MIKQGIILTSFDLDITHIIRVIHAQSGKYKISFWRDLQMPQKFAQKTYTVYGVKLY